VVGPAQDERTSKAHWAPSGLGGIGTASKTFTIPRPIPIVAKCIAASPAMCPTNGGTGDVATAPLDTTFDEEWIRPRKTGGGDVSVDVEAQRAKAAAPAIRVLNHPVQQSINKLFNTAVYGARSSTADAPVNESINIDINQLNDYLPLLEDSTAAGAWDALSDAATQADARGDAPIRKRRLHS
jgi:hypothetical protein